MCVFLAVCGLLAAAFVAVAGTCHDALQGSGFVWDGRGTVVTNYHIVKGAAEVKVRGRARLLVGALALATQGRGMLVVTWMQSHCAPN